MDSLPPITLPQDTPNGTPAQFTAKLNKLDSDQASMGESFSSVNDDETVAGGETVVNGETLEEVSKEGKVSPPTNTITL